MNKTWKITIINNTPIEAKDGTIYSITYNKVRKAPVFSTEGVCAYLDFETEDKKDIVILLTSNQFVEIAEN